MGRANFKDGGVFAQNLQAGSFDITTGGTGDGTTTVTFAKAMKNAPKVTLSAAEHLTTGVLSHASVTASGFQAKVDGADLTSDILTCHYIAFDDSFK
jgi:hypothetical protein